MKTNRRSALQTLGGLAAFALAPKLSAAEAGELYRAQNGRIRQSVVPWCFQPMSLEELAGHAVKLGIQSIELCDPKHWPMLKKAGLTCALAGSHGFAKGFAHKEEHAECLKVLEERIAQCVQAGVPSVITFSGFRRGLSTDEGFANMVAGLKQIAPVAEKAKVTLCLEMLNSRDKTTMKGHPDYFCDNIDFALEIVKHVASERVKLLFDIYHVQIMNGDIIRRIGQFHPWIGHYHTAGNPGRNEIDDTQEINYPPIMRAIAATGYQGFVGQEFVPLRDKVASLSQAVKLCDV